ncbi:conserved protein of unknown function (plasmid) [Rhodovastum atsumiense]|uniref:Uncharacterized protein n=1 Tax=Rhodovastum atsumiense TaxID=504468 RepID=A0A5M6IN07_9PROT|nr:hypothetical protein [Rhodovastum atsumiense]KAA5609641.1 hypothetical protein F1189_23040 [Rhodovastum atsumiense]CAH2606507.1 conserved protein of unknown function [Rhodovastum atsumiense]
MAYALISPAGMVAQVADAKFDVHSDWTWAELAAGTTASAGDVASKQTDGTWTFAAPSPVIVDLVSAARAALDGSDITALRCFKAGVAFPAEWLTYVQALRAIVNGTDTSSTALPARPDYPAGT